MSHIFHLHLGYQRDGRSLFRCLGSKQPWPEKQQGKWPMSGHAYETEL